MTTAGFSPDLAQSFDAAVNGPCPDPLAGVSLLTDAIYDVAYLGEQSDAEVREGVCAGVNEMKAAGMTVEATLACVKYRLRRITMGGSLDLRDEIRTAWLSDNLVRWVIQCYY